MMKTLLLALCLALASFTLGCVTSSTPPTREAIVYYAFSDTWAAAKSAYEGYCELAVQGQVSVKDQADIDAAWNQFRLGFKIALLAAQKDWNATTPESVVALKEDLITLIRSL